MKRIGQCLYQYGGYTIDGLEAETGIDWRILPRWRVDHQPAAQERLQGMDRRASMTLWMRPCGGVSMASRQKCKCTNQPQLEKHTMKKFIDTALAVASREAQIEGLTGSVKESRAAANAVKIEAYADIIAALASVPLTSKGKLPRAVSTDLRDTLLEAGVSKSCTKRYVENSTAAMRVFSIPSQATPTLVEEILATENIDSENALKKACFNSREVSDVRAFAEKLVGKFKTRFTDGGSEVATDDFHPSKLTDDQIDAALEELEDAMRELRAARDAAKVAANSAADDVEAENEAVRAFVAAGLGE
jgi:hypothetical protein